MALFGLLDLESCQSTERGVEEERPSNMNLAGSVEVE